MDDLDRLYIELVEILRRERPDGLDGQLTVAELYTEIVPYQRVREAIGLRSFDDYEIALSRLVSGERGYAGSDARDMQAEVSAGLQEAYPDFRRFHAFPDARIRLNPESIPPPGDIRYAPPQVQEEAFQRAEEERRIREEERRAREEEERHAEEEAKERAARERAEAERRRIEEERRELVRARAAKGQAVCGSCASPLPESSPKYCPYCGESLRVECDSCGAEMSIDWIYCGECGKAREGSQPDDLLD